MPGHSERWPCDPLHLHSPNHRQRVTIPNNRNPQNYHNAGITPRTPALPPMRLFQRFSDQDLEKTRRTRENACRQLYGADALSISKVEDDCSWKRRRLTLLSNQLEAEPMFFHSGDVACSRDFEDLTTPLTYHACSRMCERRIQPDAIDAVLQYGRVVPTRGGTVYAIGRKEVAKYAREGVNLVDYSGVQVVCSVQGVVLTVYRNHNFRKLRVGLGRGRFNRVGRSTVNRRR
jgi:hypothetical protein